MRRTGWTKGRAARRSGVWAPSAFGLAHPPLLLTVASKLFGALGVASPDSARCVFQLAYALIVKWLAPANGMKSGRL
jgi:hypothetical protein